MKKPKTAREVAQLILNTPDSRIESSIVVIDPKDGVIREHKLNDGANGTVGLPKPLLDYPETKVLIKRAFNKKRE